MASFRNAEISRLATDAARAVAGGDAAKALDLYRAVALLEPRNPMYALRIGDCLVRLGRRQEALPVYRRVADRFASEGQLVRAASVLRLIQRLFPRDVPSANRLVELRRKLAESRTREAAPAEPTPDDFIDMLPVLELEQTPSRPFPIPAPPLAPALPKVCDMIPETAPAPAPAGEVAALEQTVRELLAELLRTQQELEALKAQLAASASVSSAAN